MSTFELQKIGAAHIVYLMAAGAAMWSWLRWVGADSGLFAIAVCSLPALLGLVLTFTSTADPEQYVLRLMAAGMFTPLLLLFWGTSADATALPRFPWAYAAGAAILHAAVFAGAVMWVGTHTTRHMPAAGAATVDAETLGTRILSLNRIGGPLQVTNPAAQEFVVTYLYASPDRTYRVVLNLDPAAHRVRVRERASANMAKPVSGSEKSMRTIGDPIVDAARPQASSVSATVARVTPVKDHRLKATPATLRGSAVEVPEAFAAALDEEGLVTLLCAVSTRSGWEWRPAFFGAE